MSNTRRPNTARVVSRKAKEEREDALNQGIAFTDSDGARLSVRMRDVRGSHEARLRATTGLDFLSLLGALAESPGLDRTAAAVWFGRLVNGRDPGDYLELVDSISYGDLDGYEFDEPKADEQPPEA